MQSKGNIFGKIKKANLQVGAILLLILLVVVLLQFNERNSHQSSESLLGGVYFDGKYCIGDGDWHDIVPGEHIPSTEGDVTLRGNFHALAPDGQYVGIYRDELMIAFYVDHINLTICEAGLPPAVDEIENRIFGVSNCAETWVYHGLYSSPDDLIDIVIKNPHAVGNETAIDEMLSSLALYNGVDFGNGILEKGELQRNTGVMLMLASIVFLGIAMFSSLIHVKNSKIIWMIGATVLFAGLYFAYSAYGVSFWSKSQATNTTILVASMMLYMLFVSMIIALLLKSMQRVGEIAVTALGVANAVFISLPMISEMYFYDTLIWWIAVQLLVNGVLAVCLIKEFTATENNFKWLSIGGLLPLIAFAVDAFGTLMGAWKGGVVSQYVFTVLLAIAVVMVLKLIPNNINAATKARELELEKTTLNAQLAESRISTMMSQIRPHFVYNTLGSIEQLCKLDPPKAGELVHNFAKYLRGNFGELDNHKPILMSQEMEHVHYYVSIENVRFPDMTFKFEMNSSDFHIPALTVQPIVENAIKHGLMKLPKGGTIRVVSYESDDNYCISVVDDGAGFDTNALIDERKHVGLRNIRERLKVMVNGTLEIESTVGVGTKVLIKIPKEVQ